MMRLSLVAAFALLPTACGPGLHHGPPGATIERAEVAIEIPAVSATAPYTLLVGATEVTQRAFTARMGRNPSYHRDCEDCPVERVSWYDAAAYANAESEAAGLSPCYELVDCTLTEDAPAASRLERRRYPSLVGLQCADVTSRGTSCTGYRLPTRDEWAVYAHVDEVAERTRVVERYVHYRTRPPISTRIVGGRLPNRHGLHDTYGNVEEWLEDVGTRPANVDSDASEETEWNHTAGGCIYSTLRSIRSQRDRRSVAASGHGRSCIGFRLVRTAPASEAPNPEAP